MSSASPRLLPGGVILPVPTSGHAALAHPQPVKRQHRGASDAVAGSPTGSMTARASSEEPHDFLSITEASRIVPPVGTYDLPSSFGSVLSRSPRITVPKALRSARFIGPLDLYVVSKLPGPGQYIPHIDRTSFTGRDRSTRRKLAIERVNAHALYLPPLASARQQ